MLDCAFQAPLGQKQVQQKGTCMHTTYVKLLCQKARCVPASGSIVQMS